nr:DUF2946 domain-containing protein [uncultured Duganella sp.]
MKIDSHPHRIAAWLACLAMLFAVLAPSISRATAVGGWTEICTSAGMKLVKLADDGTRAPSGSLMQGEHCPFCAHHADLAGPVPQAPAMAHPIGLGEIVPRLFLQAPRPLFTWTPAQSRAPPANS